MWLSTKALIVDGEVRERNWLRYRSLPLKEIAEIQEAGRVGFGQGNVKGIVLVPIEGDLPFELRLSAYLRPERSAKWVAKIEQARKAELAE